MKGDINKEKCLTVVKTLKSIWNGGGSDEYCQTWVETLFYIISKWMSFDVTVGLLKYWFISNPIVWHLTSDIQSSYLKLCLEVKIVFTDISEL